MFPHCHRSLYMNFSLFRNKAPMKLLETHEITAESEFVCDTHPCIKGRNTCLFVYHAPPLTDICQRWQLHIPNKVRATDREKSPVSKHITRWHRLNLKAGH